MSVAFLKMLDALEKILSIFVTPFQSRVRLKFLVLICANKKLRKKMRSSPELTDSTVVAVVAHYAVWS